ncbi:carboxypeptidase regulatory-like domain-containing protein [Sphingobacterium sp. IITKGP-BTPF85]|uniref:carboxypeptidase regulatory-like domain-containing protein n=1 Tax=Sphingobacterium sp. IITKGP-BTPF85 TaxID=1338009 RepID=UPI0004216BF9|nr:carboxypeptidase regulatory-like domain-containing protein [Sphingobacterium sp. IITKGP-BTPF85]KKX48644.1 hypothetical protein L950_0220135 [Sphingobacterium sp. IITKGP-BTPF85]
MLTSPLYGQQKGRVKGTVVSQTGSLLSGVTVTVTDSLNKVITNTATDAKGLFLFESLEAGKSYNIRFSIVGYGNKEENNFIVKPADNNSILIRMEEGSSQLDEVVVVGYGTQKKLILLELSIWSAKKCLKDAWLLMQRKCYKVLFQI